MLTDGQSQTVNESKASVLKPMGKNLHRRCQYKDQGTDHLKGRLTLEVQVSMTVLPKPMIIRPARTRLKVSWLDPAALTIAPMKMKIEHAMEPLLIVVSSQRYSHKSRSNSAIAAGFLGSSSFSDCVVDIPFNAVVIKSISAYDWQDGIHKRSCR